jgi:hypothetical protein
LEVALDRGLPVPNQASATARALEFDFASRLSRANQQENSGGGDFSLSRNGNGNNSAKTPQNPWHPLQETVIEFGTPREILFVVAQRLEFADHILVESRDGALRAEASVVAVQYHPERTVVAARFLKPVPNWIVKS